MLSYKIRGLFLYPRSSLYETLRYVRGGNTIFVRKEKRQVKASVKLEKNRIKAIDRSNKGAGHILHYLQERDGKLDPDMDADDYEQIGLYDPDIDQQVQATYEDELRTMNQKSFYNIKRKYFKEPQLPNMVPYIEKQDMKILHESDPEEWNVEKLAECFPVTPQIARKILRSPFTAYTVEAVRKHDRTVQRNWKLLKEGKLELSNELRSHLEKFVDRMSFDISDHVIKKYLPEKPNFEVNLHKKEFGSIIDKYEEMKTGKKPDNVEIDQDNKIIVQDFNANIKAIPESNQSSHLAKHVTLSTLRKQIKTNPQSATEMSKLIIEMENKYVQTPPPKKIQTASDNECLEEADVVSKEYELSLPKKEETFKLRINIPKGKQKRNQLYQLRDCFYDDTGHFLFRVPGLFS